MTGTKFTELADLLAERTGGQALSCSDEFFAAKDNLVKAGRGIFIEGKYTDRGKWMDGWESRRKRVPGHDWCILKLGMRGVIRGVDIDTNHFLGNHPPHASLDAARSDKEIPEQGDWHPILAKSPLNPGSQNLYPILSEQEWTHVRLNIFPDGGVARLRVYGEVKPDWSKVGPKDSIDLAAIQNGGLVLSCNDMFFSSKDNLIMPGRGVNMGDGWETKRRRSPGHDWVILRLGRPGFIQRIEVDTAHFKGNYPDRCSIDVKIGEEWKELLPQQSLCADHQHYFEKELTKIDHPVSQLRLNIFPDGGISRLRVFGSLEKIK